MGVPHPTRGEAVKVFVVPEPQAKLTRHEVTGFVRERLANYKVPRYVEFRDELPKTLVGKVLRRSLREEGQPTSDGQGEERDVGYRGARPGPRWGGSSPPDPLKGAMITFVHMPVTVTDTTG